VGVEHDLSGPARLGLALRQHHQPGAEPLVAMQLVDPQRPHVTTASPGPSIQSTDDPPAPLACEDRQQTPVVEASSGGVELIEAFVEELHDAVVGQVGQLDLEPSPVHLGHARTSQTNASRHSGLHRRQKM